MAPRGVCVLAWLPVPLTVGRVADVENRKGPCARGLEPATRVRAVADHWARRCVWIRARPLELTATSEEVQTSELRRRRESRVVDGDAEQEEGQEAEAHRGLVRRRSARGVRRRRRRRRSSGRGGRRRLRSVRSASCSGSILQRRRRRTTNRSRSVLARGRTGLDGDDLKRRRCGVSEIQRDSDRGSPERTRFARGEALDGERTLTGGCRRRWIGTTATETTARRRCSVTDRRGSETRRRRGGFPCSMWRSERTTATWATCSCSLSVDGGAPWRAVDGDPASLNSGETEGNKGREERGGGAREERRGRARVRRRRGALVGAGEQVEGAPAVAVRRAPSAFRRGDGNRTEGGTVRERERGAGAGWAARLLRAARW